MVVGMVGRFPAGKGHWNPSITIEKGVSRQKHIFYVSLGCCKALNTHHSVPIRDDLLPQVMAPRTMIPGYLTNAEKWLQLWFAESTSFVFDEWIHT
ncbi:hypothetical protein TNCV_926791 [Trichonephila clavipes]|nr:hypothetical protein TNCV_926791 [Trichonephila clavipes]